jgi:hypothetical protein
MSVDQALKDSQTATERAIKESRLPKKMKAAIAPSARARKLAMKRST